MYLEFLPELPEHSHHLVHLVVGGSRGYGYGKETSDYDIHGIHLLSLESQLGFSPDKHETIEIKQLPVEMVTHDLKKFLWLVGKGNGNVLEDLFTPHVIFSSDIMEEIKRLGMRCITKRVGNHYRGMAHNQQRRLKEHPVKSLMHQYRCLLMGMHAMKTGEIVLDVSALVDMYDVPAWNELRYGEFAEDRIAFHQLKLVKLLRQFDEAQEQANLPNYTPEGVIKKLEQVLIEYRKTVLTV